MTNDAAAILELMDRLNFGLCRIFNVGILGDVAKLITLQKWIQENRGLCELGYVCVKGLKPSGKVIKN